MKKQPLILLLICLLFFSLAALACNTVTNAGGGFVLTQTAVAGMLSTQFVNGQGLEQTVVANVTAINPEGMILTTVALATQAVEQGSPNNMSAPGSAPEDIPIMTDAADLQVLPGVILYSTPSAVDVAREFYMNEMSWNGWSFDELKSNSSQFGSMLIFNKTGQYTAMVVINNAGGTTKIQIVYSGGG